MATFTWMLQCIAPYVTINQDTFNQHVIQYSSWLNKIRYSCTYHHASKEGTLEWLWSKVPNVPYIGEEPDPLAPPKRDAPHAHPTFDFGWGIGPIVDSYGGMYIANGTHKREPGHEETEMFDSSVGTHKWKAINAYGTTNEYIHPIVHHRRLVRGWDAHNPLKDWERVRDKGRYWWHKANEGDRALPEWVVLPKEGLPGDMGSSFSYERAFYAQCEKSANTVEKLKGETGGRDFLEHLDGGIDFGALLNKAANEYP
jgi:hypothetical protein